MGLEKMGGQRIGRVSAAVNSMEGGDIPGDVHMLL
jgi:hypothetical protein